jgi:hypothetical protein
MSAAGNWMPVRTNRFGVKPRLISTEAHWTAWEIAETRMNTIAVKNSRQKPLRQPDRR